MRKFRPRAGPGLSAGAGPAPVPGPTLSSGCGGLAAGSGSCLVLPGERAPACGAGGSCLAGASAAPRARGAALVRRALPPRAPAPAPPADPPAGASPQLLEFLARWRAAFAVWTALDGAFVLACSEAFSAQGAEWVLKADSSEWPLPGVASAEARRRAAAKAALASAWTLRAARVRLDAAAVRYADLAG